MTLAQGDVVKALDDLEMARVEQERAREEQDQDRDFGHPSNEIWDSVKSTMSNFSHSTISLKRYENTIVSLSAPLGLALAYTVWRKPGLRMLALVGAVGAAMNHFELEVASKGDPYDDDAFNFAPDSVKEEY